MHKKDKGSHGNANAEIGFSGQSGGAKYNLKRYRAVARIYNILYKAGKAHWHSLQNYILF